MNAFNQLRSAVVDSTNSLADVLRKAKLLAYSLGDQRFKEWVNHELNGYPGGTTVPEYRRLSIPSLGTFVGPIGAIVKNQILPTYNLPDSLKDFVEYIVMGNGIREIEEMAQSKKDLRRAWPAEAVILAREHIQMSGGYTLTEAYQPVTRPVLEGILDAVRNRLLDFLLELQQAHPEVSMSEKAAEQIPPDEVSQIFNVTIFGDHSVIASGKTVTQTVQQDITTNDMGALLALVRKLGVPENDVKDLQSAVEQDGMPQKGELGPKVREWFGRLMGKLSSGAWQAALQTAPALISKAFAKYYGWE